MSDERFDELTAEERAAFDAVSGPITPPPSCEDDIVAALRERELIQDGQSSRRAVVVPFPQSLVRRLPGLSMAAAALIGAFFLGAEYGSGTPAPETPTAADVGPGRALDAARGDVFKNENGEMEISPRLASQRGFRSAPAMLLAVAMKPSVGFEDYGDVGDLSAGAESFSPRPASR